MTTVIQRDRASVWRGSAVRAKARPLVTFGLFLLLVLAVWEGLKFLGGVPWRPIGAGPGAPVLWDPPFRWAFANDLNLPHVWNIVYALGQPFQRNADQSLAEYLVGASLYTWREAFIGFMRRIGMPNGLEGVGYAAGDIPALTEGALKQKRLLALSPEPVTQRAVERILEQSITIW
jgi:hypothetical protein